MLITLPLKKHSDPVNPHAGCQLKTMQQSTWRVNLTQPHPECPLSAQHKHLPSLPFLYFIFLSSPLNLSSLCIPFVLLSCHSCFFTARFFTFFLPFSSLIHLLFCFCSFLSLSSPLLDHPLRTETRQQALAGAEHSTFFTPLPLYP